MRRRWDGIRQAMLRIEDNNQCLPGELEMSLEEAQYQLHILASSDLADLIIHRSASEGVQVAIGTLSWKGHELLDRIRDPAQWLVIKELAVGGIISTETILAKERLLPKGEVLWRNTRRGTVYRIQGVAVVSGSDLHLLKDGDMLDLYCRGSTMHAMWGSVPAGEDDWQHLGEARAQFTMDPFTQGEKVLAYQDVQSGHWSLRRPQQFFDGRFSPAHIWED